MSLLTYKEARPWAKSIARAVKNRDMPPWSGESDRHTWRNDLSLSTETVDQITAWVAAGAPEGDTSALPEPPSFPESWTLGEPDYIIELDRVNVPAEGEDQFPKQILKIELDEPRWVRAIEFLPEDRRVAHHYQALYSTSGGIPQGSSGVLGIWTAGMPPYVFPDGMGRKFGNELTVIVDQHYTSIGEATTDASKIGLYWGEGELKKEVMTIPVTNTGLRIPPGAANHAENAHYLFDRDMQILAFSPHMHVRGKAMSYKLTYPDGREEMLLDVPKFDYNWQWLYYPTEPIDVPAGSRIDVTAVWDNSKDNPLNPDPSKEIIYRGDTYNEMFNGFLEVIPKEGKENGNPPQREQILNLLALHPTADSYLVDGFLKLGFFAPREGEGWLYMGGIFSISLDDFEWQGDRLRITTQFPTPEASATTTVIEGELDENGRLKGTLVIGSDTENPRKLPIMAQPVASVERVASGG